jgi:NitT/TauT family transport system permease protein
VIPVARHDSSGVRETDGAAEAAIAPTPGADRAAASARRLAVARRRHRIEIHSWQVVIVVVVLAAWEWLPQIPGAKGTAPVLDRFFISSPSAIIRQIWYLAAAAHNVPSIWPALGRTVITSVVGTVAAIIIGGLAGLLLGNYRSLAEIFAPFISALNAVPRIALIPVIVLIAGSSSVADAVTGFTVVFFLVFFSAFEGSRGVAYEMTEMMRIFGASRTGIMFRVRLPYAGAWVFVNLPNIISHGLVGVVTAELFSGGSGMGNLLVTAVDTADSTLTFGLVFYLALVGLILILGAGLLRDRLLSWWDEAGGASRSS